MSRITIITGPTASGKSSYALDKAAKQGYEIISMDSMQLYKKMNIGTAKPDNTQLSQVKHHLINILEPDEPYSAALYIKDVAKIIKEDKKFLIVGGTGLYLSALLNGLSFPMADPDPVIRKTLQERIEKEGSKALWNELKQVDQKATEKITINDKFRIIRALEVYQKTGTPISSLQKRDRTIIPKREVICLTLDKEILYNRINQRVDVMIDNGLVDEVTQLLNSGLSPELPSMQAIGYKELISHLQGEISLKDAIELIKKKSRNFAKRQYTWFRSFPEIQWIEVK